MSSDVHWATYGNRNGSHQLLDSTLPASSIALEELRFLVDRPAGHIDASVAWSPYWGCQRVGEWWAVWRGEEDPEAPRKNMVRVKVALLPLITCESSAEITPLLQSLGHEDFSLRAELAATVVEHLAATESPVAIPDLHVAPGLLAALWPRLWPSARRELTIRTVFVPESLNITMPPKIALFPLELLARWRSATVITEPQPCSSPAGKWFAGETTSFMKRLLEENKASLPGDFSVLLRLNRLVEKLELLHTGQGALADALLVVRTQEAFPDGFRLPEPDAKIMGDMLRQLANGSVQEVRAASLTRLDQVPDRRSVVDALARWVETQLAHSADQDALWILQHHLSASHSEWWRNGIRTGLMSAIESQDDSLVRAIWRWLSLRPQALDWFQNYLKSDASTEKWLASAAPDLPQGQLLDRVIELCSKMDWAALLSYVLRGTRPLTDVVDLIRHAVQTPDAGLDAMLANRGASEVVVAAANTGWSPLLKRAAELTQKRPQLFGAVVDSPALFTLLLIHLRVGGQFPEELLTETFLDSVFDGLLDGASDAIQIAANLPLSAGGFALDHKNVNRLLELVSADVLSGAAEHWWTRFLNNGTAEPPPRPIQDLVIQSVPKRTKGASVTLVVRLLELLPAIEESTFTKWMQNTGFHWDDGNYQQMAYLLETRQWSSAAHTFRWSWKQELKLVAWYARSLLSWFDSFLSPPKGASSGSAPLSTASTTVTRRNDMMITFLASNPLKSGRLALDEEVRAIEEKLRLAKHRDFVTFRTRWAVRPEDLQQALLEDEPVVVHFSGHGGGSVGIVLHSQDQDSEHLVTEDALSDLFRVLKDDIRVVVLNACYSEVQAQAIVQEIDFVVGMSDSVADAAASAFAAAFYRGLAFGRSVQTAFELGLNELRLAGHGDEDDIPKLLVRSGVDASSTILVEGAFS